MSHYLHGRLEKNLVAASSTQSLEQAALEWALESHGHSETFRSCQLCNTSVKEFVVLRNTVNGARLVIGCNCYDTFHAYLVSHEIKSPLTDRRKSVRRLKQVWKKTVSADKTFLGWLVQECESGHIDDATLREAITTTLRLGFPSGQEMSEMMVGYYKNHRLFPVKTLLCQWERQMLVDRDMLDAHHSSITINQAASFKEELLSKVREELQESWVLMRDLVPDEQIDDRYQTIEDNLSDSLKKESAIALKSAVQEAVAFSEELEKWRSAPWQKAFLIPDKHTSFTLDDNNRWSCLFVRCFPLVTRPGFYSIKYAWGKAWVDHDSFDPHATISGDKVLLMLGVKNSERYPHISRSSYSGNTISEAVSYISGIDSGRPSDYRRLLFDSLMNCRERLKSSSEETALLFPYNDLHIRSETQRLLLEMDSHASQTSIERSIQNIRSATNRYECWRLAIQHRVSDALVVPDHNPYALILHQERWAYRRITLLGCAPDDAQVFQIVTYGDHSEGARHISYTVIVDRAEKDYSRRIVSVDMCIPSSREHGGFIGRAPDGNLVVPSRVIEKPGKYLCFLQEKKPTYWKAWIIKPL